MLSEKLLMAVKKQGGAPPTPKPSTLLFARMEDFVTIYNVSDWSEFRVTAALSCGNASANPYSGIEVSPDNSFYLTEGNSGTGAYSTTDDSQLFFESSAIRCQPKISKDGAYIIYGTAGLTCKVVRTSDWLVEATITLSYGNGLHIFAWSHDNSKVAIMANTGRIEIYETTGWTLWNTPTFADNPTPEAMSFSPDDTQIALSRSVNPKVTVQTVQQNIVMGDLFTFTPPGGNSFGNAYIDNIFYATGYDTPAGLTNSWDSDTWILENSSPVYPIASSLIIPSNDGSLLAICAGVGGGGSADGINIVNPDLTIAPSPVGAGATLGLAWDRPV